ncbi:CCA tRNA nucleotidyltransferase [Falsirhodobacter sp. 20TX0035]|uniref:CCA tRNA nucleotidyltransferase n=1 Tax=Falsirhodobacter sp. 20TX0035 TaxID=3022019 RepID=UPI00232DD63A|nr:CCA tRNA nucleotidyltransferase [Falsirhodobacter sp. 20TX0035]MDB6452694.1 CCA tRNA nucleotidyltransferase [Falsirhodobacter sp. 20TX0035]
MKIEGDWLAVAEPVCTMLTDAGHRALFVGGCVRNALLGAPVSDLDIATDARPERVMALAKATGLRAIPTGIDHGTVTVLSEGQPFEITTFRRDVDTDGRHATVAFTEDVAEDAARRDFTMNALYAKADGTVLDPLGGLPDLKARHVRFVGDPAARITEDYLRILRFFRFHAIYGEGGPDAEGLAACAEHADGIDTLSRERVGAEMKKLLAARDPAPAVASMATTGVLHHVLPGADPKPLAVLVHLEGGLPPDPLRRLASLATEADLRLSRAEAARLSRLASAAREGEDLRALAFRHGADLARDAGLVRGALTGTPPDLSGIKEAAAATFPVTARDLMPAMSGPALGERLRALESRWIASGFRLTRDQLLD